MRNPLFNSSVLVVAVTYGLLLRLAMSAGLFGLLLLVLVLLSLWRYAYAVLRSIAQGRTNIPAPDAETMNPIGEWRSLVHFVFFAVTLVFLATTPLFGDGMPATLLRWIGAAALVGVFPASAALMGFTRNPAAALNPAGIMEMIATIGPAVYAKLLLACAGLSLFVWFAPEVLAPGRNFLVLLLCDIAAVWALLGVFALIGAALRERRAEFDIPGELEEEWRQRDRQREWQRSLDRAYGSIRGGLTAEGYRTIKELARAENESIEIYQWMFNGMLSWHDQTHALQVGGRFIERLLEVGRAQVALELADQCRRLSREFVVPADAAARLADYARTIGRHGAADELAALSRRVPSP